MRLLIRNKILLSFSSVVLIMFILVGILITHQLFTLHKTINSVNHFSKEMNLNRRLSAGFAKIVMPANEYIITGKQQYIDEFNRQAKDFDQLFLETRLLSNQFKELGFADTEKKLALIEELENELNEVKKISAQIFTIKEPIGDIKAAALMEKLDYQVIKVSVDKINAWHNTELSNMTTAVDNLYYAFKHSLYILLAGIILILGCSLILAFIISKQLTSPILSLQKGSKAISKGEYSHRIQIETGDEFEQLGTTFNAMAKSLQEEVTALSRSEKRYRTLINTAPAAILLVDPEVNEILEANPAAETLTGYSVNELTGMRADTLYPEEHLSVFIKNCEQIMVTEGGELLDTTIVKNDGSTLHVDIITSVVMWNSRQLILCFIRDISARKELDDFKAKYTQNLENKLDTSKERLEAIAYTAMDATVMVNNSGHIRFWNPAAQKLFGYCEKEAANIYLYDLLFEEDSFDRFKDGFKSFVTTGRGPFVNKMTEITARRKDGTTVPVFLSLSAVKSNGGFGAVCIIHDITELKRVKSVSMELGRILKNSLNEIYIFDADTLKFVYANERACKNIGYCMDELKSMTPLDIKPQLTYDSFQRLINPARMENEQTIEFSTVHKRKDGSIYPIEVHLQHSTYNSAPVFVTFLLDVTERKKAETAAHREAEKTANLLKLSEANSNTADIETFMLNIVTVTQAITKTTFVVSYLWNSETNTFRPCTASGLSKEKYPIFKTVNISLNNDIIKEIMDSGCAHIYTDINEVEEFSNSQNGFGDLIENAQQIVLLPLVGKREYLGFIVCICIKKSEPGCDCMLKKDTDIMEAIASQVSTSLEEAIHYKESIIKAMELSEKVETIQTMSDISKSILSTLNINSIIEMAARMVSRLVPAEWVRVIEVDEEKEEFNFKAGFEDGGLLESMIVPFSSTSLVDVVYTKRPQYIADLRELDTPFKVEKALVKRGYLSVLRIPIVAKGSVIGVLGLMAKKTAAFSQKDLTTLETLSSQMGVAIENARLVKGLEEFSLGTVTALAAAIDAKSPWTSGHSDRVTGIALSIGEKMGLNSDELKEFKIAGLLHDIGKIGTNEAILDKKSRLTDEEFNEVKKHPSRGAEILSSIKQLAPVLPVIRGHHEFYDGTGYPDGLKGTNIPLLARILTVADTVDAMGADRPYRQGLPQEKIVAELKRCSGKQFDPHVVDIYLGIQQ